MKCWFIRILRSLILFILVAFVLSIPNHPGLQSSNGSSALIIVIVTIFVLCALLFGVFRWLRKFDPNCSRLAFLGCFIVTLCAISIAVSCSTILNANKRRQRNKQLTELNTTRESDLTQRSVTKLNNGQDVDYITSAEALIASDKREAIGDEGFTTSQKKILQAVREHYEYGLQLKKIGEDAGLKFFELGGIRPDGLENSTTARSKLAALTELSRAVSNLSIYWLNYIDIMERRMLAAGASQDLATEVATRSAKHYMTNDQLLLTGLNSDSAEAARNLVNFLILTSHRWTYDSAQDAIMFELDSEIESYKALLGKFETVQKQIQINHNQIAAKRNSRINSR